MPRISVSVEGVVQGVGFRPFVYASAVKHGLAGWVRNDGRGVELEIEGDDGAIAGFLEALRSPPAGARIERVLTRELPHAAEHAAFHIRESTPVVTARPVVPADLAICAECAREMDTHADRRAAYAFINCTHCGPRYSIIEALPYDRPRTSMREFVMCERCAREYVDPSDRRFHAQPIACHACGPTLALVDDSGSVCARGDAAIEGAADALRDARIVALKGLGGYQILCDATNEHAVECLRRRKGREEKPFAVMFPSLDALRRACILTRDEERALTSPEAPILLLRRGEAASVAPSVAPRNPRLGAMLPYTPLHRLLLARTNRPVVCTSGNRSEEPMCTEDSEVLTRLGSVADLFLMHDRPIVRPVDDSVARIGPTGLELIRRARGYAPLPVALAGEGCVLAFGGQLKNTVALAIDGQVVVSQHIGDLTSVDGMALCARTADDLRHFFGARPERVACDLHPDYASTRLAEQYAAKWEVPVVRVQHHHAHIAACMAEHSLTGAVLGLAWDGSGLGTDGVLWGGEALVVDRTGFQRVAHLRPFSLPGGERAIREPRRAAMGILHEIFGTEATGQVGSREPGDEILAAMLARRVNAPRTTSAGRLFDAVAALIGVCTRAGFEGQAAMELENAATGVDDDGAYAIPLGRGLPVAADWEPLVRAVLTDVRRGVSTNMIAARFHSALGNLAVAIAERARLHRVVLSGGCFQNLLLATTIRRLLTARGFKVFTPRLFPPNDGGLSLGQALVARMGR